MGLFDSKKSTKNIDNRIVNDYAGAEWDNSVSNEYDNSVSGEYAGNTGTITVLDGGVIDLAAENLNSMTALASESFSLSNEAIQVGQEIASLGVDGGIELATIMAESSTLMLSGSLSANSEVLNVAALSLDDTNARTISAALMFNDSNNELALSLAQQNGEAALVAQSDNNNALANGFKSSMQFVEQFSRSDGNAIAETNMKTIGIIGLGLVVSAYIFKKVK